MKGKYYYISHSKLLKSIPHQCLPPSQLKVCFLILITQFFNFQQQGFVIIQTTQVSWAKPQSSHLCVQFIPPDRFTVSQMAVRKDSQEGQHQRTKISTSTLKSKEGVRMRSQWNCRQRRLRAALCLDGNRTLLLCRNNMCSVCLIFYLLVFICMCVSEWMGFPWRQKGAGFLELK